MELSMEDTTNWIDFWKERKLLHKEKNLKSLLTYEGGWYGPCTGVDTSEFISFVKSLKDYYKLRGSIYEIGCGPGAFLYVFQSIGFEVGGLDVNEHFLEFARECIPVSVFDNYEACDVPIEEKYDYILITNSINLFPSEEYVYLTLSKCVEKANVGVLIIEINDINYINEYSKIIKSCPAIEFKDKNAGKKYITGKRLYLNRDFFIDFAKKFNLSVSFQKTNELLHHGHSTNYRFNAFLTKK